VFRRGELIIITHSGVLTFAPVRVNVRNLYLDIRIITSKYTCPVRPSFVGVRLPENCSPSHAVGVF